MSIPWCSHACILFWPEGQHDPSCTPIDPPTEGQRAATRERYREERVRANLKASEARYLALQKIGSKGD